MSLVWRVASWLASWLSAHCLLACLLSGSVSYFPGKALITTRLPGEGEEGLVNDLSWEHCCPLREGAVLTSASPTVSPPPRIQRAEANLSSTGKLGLGSQTILCLSSQCGPQTSGISFLGPLLNMQILRLYLTPTEFGMGFWNLCLTIFPGDLKFTHTGKITDVGGCG